jgi:hypothetical protein
MSYAWLDRVNSWYNTTKRRRIPATIAWLRATAPEISLQAGWGLITLSAFGWNLRAWEASIGIYLIVSVLVRIYSVYYARKLEASRRRIDQ